MKKEKFCPICGKITEELIEGLCEKCFALKFLGKLPSKIVIKVCSKCGRIRFGGKLVSLEKVLEKKLGKFALPENFRLTYRIVNSKVVLTIYRRKKEIGRKEIELKAEKIICKTCKLKLQGYFESKLQLRGDFSEEAKEVIEGFIKGIGKDEFFISKVEKLKEGYDIYLSSKKLAKIVLKFLKKQYNFETKVSRSLWGIKEGKRFYKDTVLVRIYGRRV